MTLQQGFGSAWFDTGLRHLPVAHVRVVIGAFLLAALRAHTIRAVAPCVAVLGLPVRAGPTRAVDTRVRSGVAIGTGIIGDQELGGDAGLRLLPGAGVRAIRVAFLLAALCAHAICALARVVPVGGHPRLCAHTVGASVGPAVAIGAAVVSDEAGLGLEARPRLG